MTDRILLLVTGSNNELKGCTFLMNTTDLPKTALITGTSSGIGLRAAIHLAQAGFMVIATMRDVAKAAPLRAAAQEAGVTIDVRPLNVQDDASVTSCVQGVLTTYGHIDLLINNAGAGYLGTLEQTPLTALQSTMDTNFFGVWRLVQAVLPSMRVAGTGRIITVTSVGGLIGQPFNDAYCAAKFAVEGFMESLAPVARRLGVTLTLIEPGPVNTEFVASVLAQAPPPSPEIQAAYGLMLDAYMGTTEQTYAALGQTPDQVAEVILNAATTATPHFRYTTSPSIQNLVAQKYVDPTGDNLVAFFAARLP